MFGTPGTRFPTESFLAAMKVATPMRLLAIALAFTFTASLSKLAGSFATTPMTAFLSPLSITSGACQPCPTTIPNGRTPPGEHPSPNHHGNGALWTVLWPDGVVEFRPGGPGFILSDGSLSMKFPWWRGVQGKLSIQGRRLDALAPPLRAEITNGYGDIGFQATSIIFPTEGCWEITGKVGDASLTFVTRVVKVAKRK